MTEQTHFGDPDGTRDHAKDVSAAGQRLKSKIGSLQTEIMNIHGSTPWGSDEPGREFKKSYEPNATEYLEAAPGVGDAIDGIGEAVVATVDMAEGTDAKGSHMIVRATVTKTET